MPNIIFNLHTLVLVLAIASEEGMIIIPLLHMRGQQR